LRHLEKVIDGIFRLENSVAKEGNNDLVLASLKMAHIFMQTKHVYTGLKSVVLPCLEITDDFLHGKNI